MDKGSSLKLLAPSISVIGGQLSSVLWTNSAPNQQTLLYSNLPCSLHPETCDRHLGPILFLYCCPTGNNKSYCSYKILKTVLMQNFTLVPQKGNFHCSNLTLASLHIPVNRVAPATLGKIAEAPSFPVLLVRETDWRGSNVTMGRAQLQSTGPVNALTGRARLAYNLE